MQNCTFFQSISIFQRSLFAPQRGALGAAELRYLSASGRFMHLWCVVCGGATLVGYFMLSPKGGYFS